MWAGISVDLLIGATLYFLLALPARALARAPAAAPAAAPERAACAS